jgi:alpha-D-xyloside xylohydrolase
MVIDVVQTITVSKKGNSFELESNPLNWKTTFKTETII